MTGLSGPAQSVEWFGDRAVAVLLRAPDTRQGVVEALQQALPGRLVRAGMESVLVEDRVPDASLLGDVRQALAGVAANTTAATSDHPEVIIRVRYDGDDLVEAAATLGLGIVGLVAAHTEQRWTVAMMGFAPGFGYLIPDGARSVDWSRLPRRDQPRARVPAGSVAVAAGMSAVYPEAMPGGWHLIGRTAARLFDPMDESSPTLFHPGDRVRFVEEPR
jgi:KipI family sensor histidine kinase inhibitor